MRIINVDQNSEEWFHEREGKITGSRVANVFTAKLANKADIIEAVIKDQQVPEEELKDTRKGMNKMPLDELIALLPKEVYDEMFHKSQKKEYWRLLAESLGYTDADEDGIYEDPRERGHRLEETASDKVAESHGVTPVQVGMCVRDDYEQIAISPDRLIPKTGTVVDIDENGYITNVDTAVFEGGIEIKNPGVANHLEIIFTNEVPSEYWDQCLQYFVVTDIDYLLFVSHNPNVKEKPLHIIRLERKDLVGEIEASYWRQINIIKHIQEDVINLSF